MFNILSAQQIENTQKVIWIGGWASPMGCWSSLLKGQYPNVEHVYYDIADLLLNPKVVLELENSLTPSTFLVGWSTGSLWIHHWMKKQDVSNMESWKDVQVCSVSPIFTFCANEEQKKGWPTSVVNRMIQLLKRSSKFREGVLQDFWKSMERGSSIPEEYKVLWWEQAQTFSEEQLVKGLEFLRDVTVDVSDLDSWKNQWSLCIDKKDPIAIWNHSLEKQLTHFNCTFHSHGHVPFF